MGRKALESFRSAFLPVFISELLVERTGFNMRFLILGGWKELQRPQSPGLRHLWVKLSQWKWEAASPGQL